MLKKTWIFLDTAEKLYVQDLDIVGENANWSVSKRRLAGGPNDGVDLIKIDNGSLKVCIIPTRGMGIWYVRKDDWRIGWTSPTRGPVNPRLVNLYEPSGIGWLRGFDEFLVRCGLQSNGAPEFNDNGTLKYSLHGRIQNTPAQRVVLSVDEDEQTIQIVGQVYESSMFGFACKLTSTITMKFGEDSFHINDTITNLYNRPQNAQLLYHINFGEGLLEEGARFHIPYEYVVPRNDWAAAQMDRRTVMDPPVSQTEEACFYYLPGTDDDGNTAAMLTSADETRGVAVAFNTRQLPYFTQWKCPMDLTEGYVAGLEPAANYPNQTSFEQNAGRTISLEPNGSWCCDLDINVCADAESVNRWKEKIDQYQANVDNPVEEPTPTPELCP